ncbi:MAG: FkbM family methyltransferase [Pseudomonadales bacterium]|uniref:FkbM family methyltransferase n=1 Tax=Oleiphilus messinensis TaxID=141451 RepID=A0A1Y0I9G7_9GAMM|nr:FkbM family methyltransferase [Oleiphilus messinensis]ARU57158.1 FkbM family methyltransferase [Oleiphilus messinensis]MCG8613850.1 FkbM family methyltransferase [Pseudomonadales bacterium]
MAMQHCRYQSRLIAYLQSLEISRGCDFTLMDVGASGGIEDIWRQFEPNLQGVGFDPLVSEINRLNDVENNPRFKYVDAWLTCENDGVASAIDNKGYGNNQSFHQTSAQKAADLMSLNYTEQYFNSGSAVVHSSHRMSLDTYLVQDERYNVDFLKVDTDGHDYFVLRGAEKLLSQGDVIGVQVECQFHGSLHPHASIFSNIDLYLRGLGFTLFDLDCWHYTNAALPGEFYYRIPAQTRQGQVQWCDALYVRGIDVESAYTDKWIAHNNHHKLLKMMMVLGLFGQEDSVAGLVQKLVKQNYVIPGVDYKTVLNLLVPDNPWGINDYDSYMAKFQENPGNFYPPE